MDASVIVENTRNATHCIKRGDRDEVLGVVISVMSAVDVINVTSGCFDGSG